MADEPKLDQSNDSESRFHDAGFFVLRTPLLPLWAFSGWAEATREREAVDGGAVSQMTSSDLEDARRAWMRNLLERREVAEALEIASPSLWSSATRETGAAGVIAVPAKSRGALVRYLSRMATRCTPFGLFAGVSSGRVAERSSLRLSEPTEWRRKARLDMGVVADLCDKLAKDASVRRNLVFRPNSSLYVVGGGVRYAMVHRSGGQSVHELVTAVASEELDAALAAANEGITWAMLRKQVASACGGASDAEVDTYLDELVDAQLLVAEFGPVLTGDDPIGTSLAEILHLPDGHGLADGLQNVKEQLDRLSSCQLGDGEAHWRALRAEIAQLPVGTAAGREVQVDLVKPGGSLALSAQVMTAIAESAAMLCRACECEMSDSLDKFRDRFVDRYDAREVPLAEALDDESGVGFAGSVAAASPLLRGVAFDGEGTGPTRSWTNREDVLLHRLLEPREDPTELVLTDVDVRRMSRDDVRLPDTMQYLCRLEAESADALDAGRFRIHARGLTGPTGVAMLGRFCHADEVIRAHVTEFIEQEEARNPEVVFAEIVHLPEGRVGNIVQRPRLRDYEVVYLGRSGAPAERQLLISDLMISVKRGRVVVRSMSLDREVRPRLTSAHNAFRGLPLYRFLNALQTQGMCQSVHFSWGALSGLRHLPRVVHGNTVLSPATWNVRQHELPGAERQHHGPSFADWCQRLGLPRVFGLVDGDNVLAVDSQNSLSVEGFLELVRGRKTSVRLIEMDLSDTQHCVTATDGRYVHELIVPLVSPRSRVSKARPDEGGGSESKAATSVHRKHTPGSSWLYAKFYCGAHTIDELVGHVVGPLARRAVADGHVARWFFVRFSDPDLHLRFRCEGPPALLWNHAWPAVSAGIEPYVRDGRVWKVQLDTYVREVERYGGPAGVVLAEDAFYADSEAAVDVVGGVREDDTEWPRWAVVLAALDRMCDDFGLSLVEKRACMARLAAGRASQGTGKPLRRSVNEKYRAERQRISVALDPQRLAEVDSVCAEALVRRSRALQECAWRLREQADRGLLTVGVTDIVGSLLHMQVNRYASDAANRQESVMYEWLGRWYDSVAARKSVKDGS